MNTFKSDFNMHYQSKYFKFTNTNEKFNELGTYTIEYNSIMSDKDRQVLHILS